MRFLVMFVSAVCLLFLIKLRWPKKKNFYDMILTFLTFLRPSTLDTRPTTLDIDPRYLTLDPRPSTLDPRPSTLDPRPSTLDPRPSTLDKNLHSKTSGTVFPNTDLPAGK